MRILIADDHDLVRETLAAFLTQDEDMETVVVRDLDEALSKIADQPAFDLILLDYGMPGMNGLEGLDRARAMAPDQHVALISGTASRDVAEEALARGAAGFLPKTLAAKRLVKAVKFMAMGEQYAPVDFMTAEAPQPKAHPLVEKLSEREVQMLKGLSAGKSNKEIARDLDLSEPTIKLHMKTLYRKIDVSNRTQAALIAHEAGLA
jgi:DNA-binding NarL/FixJ family response regulator